MSLMHFKVSPQQSVVALPVCERFDYGFRARPIRLSVYMWLSACRRGSRDMQVVLITGCGSGLGKALARSFHKQAAFAGKPSGFRVFASDLNLDSIEDLRLEGIEVLALDVTKAESVQEGVSHVEQEAGRLDILVCNAGIVTIAPLIEEELSEIQAVWNVNTLGALLSARAVAPIMIRQRSGIMALTGSIFADYTAPFNGAYASSKAAVTSLFDALRLELEPYNISVCVVEPGFFTSKLRNSCFDPSRYLEGDSLYSQASLTMSDMVTYQDNLRHVASAEDVAEVIVKKLCRKRGPPPRFSVGTLAWLFKLLGFLCNFLIPRVMHTVLLVYFGLNKKW